MKKIIQDAIAGYKKDKMLLQDAIVDYKIDKISYKKDKMTTIGARPLFGKIFNSVFSLL